MRISDWSSDVCSSDLSPGRSVRALPGCHGGPAPHSPAVRFSARRSVHGNDMLLHAGLARAAKFRHGAKGPRIQRAAGADRRLLFKEIADPAEHAGLLPGLGKAHLADIGIAELRRVARSEEHTSELQSLMRSSYAV